AGMTAVDAAASARPQPPTNAKRNLALTGTAIVVVLCALTVGVEPDEILALPGGVGRVFYEMFLRNGVEWGYLPDALRLMLESLQIAWLGTVIGAMLSLPLGFFGAKNVSSGLVSNTMRQILNAIRAFPEVVLAIAVMIPIAGIGPVPGALAIGLHSVGTLGKLTAEVIEGIDSGPVEAARASGARALQVQRWGVVPQVLPEIVAFWLYRFEINIRAAAILGVVGAGGIGFVLQQAIIFGRFERAGLIIIVVIVATILVDTISGWVRRRIIEGTGARRVTGEPIEEPAIAEQPELTEAAPAGIQRP
ncbi:MAG: phosphonate ABC transporter, permease protein PhnE, partial [Chloroflexota bacterium]|nr:phosphonate ABC transporter, permease protein PhnE [Chloroflexota bacterium]